MKQPYNVSSRHEGPGLAFREKSKTICANLQLNLAFNNKQKEATDTKNYNGNFKKANFSHYDYCV